MNKFDITLCIILLLIGSIAYLLKPNDKGAEAIVYYENDIVLNIDLSDTTKREYTVNGYNGDVLIETVDGKVRVKEEISPKHLCSKQGYISKKGESIICLPNKVVIEIENDDVDAVVR